ncbi:hypothetical protein FCS83_09505 [Oenococcus sp. UCMA 17063]|nr:hypothetical protein [Oenococcus sp. UCMA 17063]
MVDLGDNDRALDQSIFAERNKFQLKKDIDLRGQPIVGLIDGGVGTSNDFFETVTENLHDLVIADDDEFRILFHGEISALGAPVILPIPLPKNIKNKTIDFLWTLTLKTPVDGDSPDKYTKYGIEDALYPDLRRSIFRKKGEKTFILKIQDPDDREKIETLTNLGYKKSPYPYRDNNKYLTEDELRSEELKWETIKTQHFVKRVSSIEEPFIRLTGLSRDGKRSRIEYSLVLSIRIKNDLNIYQDVLTRYQQLLPLQNGKVSSGKILPI